MAIMSRLITREYGALVNVDKHHFNERVQIMNGIKRKESTRIYNFERGQVKVMAAWLQNVMTNIKIIADIISEESLYGHVYTYFYMDPATQYLNGRLSSVNEKAGEEVTNIRMPEGINKETVVNGDGNGKFKVMLEGDGSNENKVNLCVTFEFSGLQAGPIGWNVEGKDE